MAMVFLAGEVCVDYSHRLKRELDSSRLWINAYSNDFCSYIPSERLVEEGGYGGGAEMPYFALPAKLRPGLEQRIIDEVRRQVPDSLIKEPGRFVVPDSLIQVAESLLDGQLDTDERVKIIQNHPWVSADLVSVLSSDLKNDSDAPKVCMVAANVALKRFCSAIAKAINVMCLWWRCDQWHQSQWNLAKAASRRSASGQSESSKAMATGTGAGIRHG